MSTPNRPASGHDDRSATPAIGPTPGGRRAGIAAADDAGRTLPRHVAWAVVAKLLLLALLYVLFFSPAHRADVDAGHAADRLLSPG